jgi:hypothetical protein
MLACTLQAIAVLSIAYVLSDRSQCYKLKWMLGYSLDKPSARFNAANHSGRLIKNPADLSDRRDF